MVSFCYLDPMPRLVYIDTEFFSVCSVFLRYRMMNLISSKNLSSLEFFKILPKVPSGKIPKLNFSQSVKTLQYFYGFYGFYDFVRWTRYSCRAHKEHVISKKVGGAKSESANLKSSCST